MRHGYADTPAGLGDAPNLGQRALIIGDMLQHFAANDLVKGVVSEGQFQRIGRRQAKRLAVIVGLGKILELFTFQQRL